MALLGIENEKERTGNRSLSAFSVPEYADLARAAPKRLKDDLASNSFIALPAQCEDSEFDARLVHSIIHIPSRREVE